MGWAIPRTTEVALREGDRGIGVWALQKALNRLPDYSLRADGDFGPRTQRIVKKFQTAWGLEADGIAGFRTQAALARVHADRPGAPAGLLLGFAEREGGLLLTAVNWQSPGGVDCGVFQRRIYEADYQNDVVIQRAFNAPRQARLLRNRLRTLRDTFLPRPGTQDGYGGMGVEEKAWRLAALDHNFPAAATRLSRTPIKQLPAYWTTEADWVSRFKYRFPDGTLVRTPLEWCHLYAGVLAGKHGHQGNVTHRVRSWTV